MIDLADRLDGFLELLIVGQPATHCSNHLAAQAKLPSDKRLAGGYWIAPSVLTEMPPSAPIMREEVFGPVAGIIAQVFGVSAVFPAAACASIVAFALTIITRFSPPSKAGEAP